MYLTNDERQALGLEGHGSDVPVEVVEAARAASIQEMLPPPVRKARAKKAAPVPEPEPAEPVVEQPDESPHQAAIPERHRAREEDGTFREDDPATPDVDEAWE